MGGATTFASKSQGCQWAGLVYLHLYVTQLGRGVYLSEEVGQLLIGGAWFPGCWRHVGTCDQVLLCRSEKEGY